MYIQPNTTVYLLKSVPLNKDYTDTLWFDNATQQATFFSGLTKKVFNNQTYQRVNRNRIRLQIKADDMYDYNYMMFRNTSYENKWFYAFIDTPVYINDNTTEIDYEIDVMQTWLFEAELGESYIVREHSETDIAGEHLLPEPLTLDKFRCYGMVYENTFGVETNWYACIAFSLAGETS